jgi:hypothetical protein
MASYEELLAEFGGNNEEVSLESQAPLFSADWDSVITETAQNYPNIPEQLVRSLIQRESSGDPYAEIDTGTKWGKARGLGQFIDETAKRYIPDWKDPSDSYDPVKNIKGIYAYLDDLVEETGSLEKALIKYHGGTVDRLGTKSEDYAKQILSKVKDDISFKPESSSYEDLLAEFGGVTEQVTEQPTEQVVSRGESVRSGDSFLNKLGQSATSSLAGVESAIAAAPGLTVDAILTLSNNINKAINFFTNKTFNKKFLAENMKAPEWTYDIAGKVKEKISTDNKTVNSLLDSFSSKHLKDIQQTTSQSSKMTEEGKGVVGSLWSKLKKGEIKNAAEYLTYATVENGVQNILAAVVSAYTARPELGLAILAGTSASDKMREYVENGNQTDDRTMQVLNSINTGLMEYAGERVGTFEILKPLRNKFFKIASEVGVDQAKKIITKPIVETIKNIAKNTGKEVSSEVLTQLGQNLGDIIAGDKEMTLKEAFSGVADAGLLAITSSGPMTTLGSISETNQNIRQQELQDVQQELQAVDEQGNPVSTMTERAQQLIDEQGEVDESPYIESFDMTEEDLLSRYEYDKEGRNLLKSAVTTDPKIDEETRSRLLSEMDQIDNTTEEVIDEEESQETETLLNEQEPAVEPQLSQEATTPIPTTETPPNADLPSVETATEQPQSQEVIPANEVEQETPASTPLVNETTSATINNEVVKTEPILSKEQKKFISRLDVPEDKLSVAKEIVGNIDFSVPYQNKSEEAKLGPKFKRLIRIIANNPEFSIELNGEEVTLKDAIKGKTRQQVAEIADLAALGTELEAQGAGSTMKKQERRQFIESITNGMEYTPELEQRIKKEFAGNKDFNFDKIFEVVTGDVSKKEQNRIRREGISKGYRDVVYTSSKELINKEEGKTGTIYKLSKEDKPAKLELTNYVISELNKLQGKKVLLVKNPEKLARLKGEDVQSVDAKDIDVIFDRDDVSVRMMRTSEPVIKTDSNSITPDVRKVVKESLKVFKGSTKIPSIVVGKKFGTIELSNRDYGAIFNGKDGGSTIMINPDIPKSQIVPTVVHELFGHYGASKVVSSIDKDLAQYARDLFQKDIDSDFTKKIANTYAKQIEKDPTVLFDEWLAKRVEDVAKEYYDKDGNFNEAKYKADESVLKKVYNFIRGLSDRIFKKWFKQKASKTEIDAMAKAIIQQFSKIDDSGYTGQTRRSVAATEVENKPKKKRKPPKQLTAKQKAETYVADKIKLRLSDRNIKIRFYDFVNKHLYGVGADSYRRQIFGLIEKVEAVDDVYYKKAMELVDESIDYKKSHQAFVRVRAFKMKHKNLLKKSDPDYKKIATELESLEADYKKFVDYTTMKRLNDRGEVLKPKRKDKAGNLISTKPGARYNSLREQKFAEIITKDGEEYYTLTDLGKKTFPQYKKDLTTADGMFDAQRINSTLVAIKEEFKAVNDKVRSTKKENKTETEIAVEDIGKQVSAKKRTPKQIKSANFWNYSENPFWRWVGSPRSLTNINLKYKAEEMDGYRDDGMFQKYITNPMAKNRRKVYENKNKLDDGLKEDFIKYDLSYKDMRRMSDQLSVGIVERSFAGDRKKRKRKVRFDNGEVEMSEAREVSLYLLAQNEYGYNHLVNGGFLIETDDGNTEPFVLTDNDILSLGKRLNTRQKKLVKIIKSHFERQAEIGNEVSLADIGEKIFNEPNYFPILVHKDYLASDKQVVNTPEDLRQTFFKGLPSITKARQDSKQPIILEDPFIAIARTYTLFNQYMDMVMVTNKVWNIINNDKFRTMMIKNGYEAEFRAMYDDVKEMMTVKVKDSSEQALKIINSVFTVSVLGYKPSVALSQPIATVLYFHEMDIGWREFAKASLDVRNWFSKSTIKEKMNFKNHIEKLSPYLKERFNNSMEVVMRGTQNRATAAQMFLGGKKLERDHLKFILSSRGAMSWIQDMDTSSIMGIWKLLEIEAVAKGYKRGTTEFDNYVARRTEYITQMTQQTFDPFDSPPLARSTLGRLTTRFLSQSLKSGMMLRKQMYKLGDSELSVKDRTKAGLNALGIILSQSVAVELMKVGIKAVGGGFEDDEWKTLEYWAKSLATNVLTLFGTPGIILGGILGGYGNVGGGNFGALTERIGDAKKKLVRAINNQDANLAVVAVYELAKTFLPIGGPEQLYKFAVGLVEMWGVGR